MSIFGDYNKARQIVTEAMEELLDPESLIAQDEYRPWFEAGVLIACQNITDRLVSAETQEIKAFETNHAPTQMELDLNELPY